MPVVSVIIPHYNRSDLLKICLESLIVQTFLDWEAIVIDDYSDEDEIESIEQTLCDFKDNRIKFIKSTSSIKGAPVCRNQGIELANAELIIFLDSDDILAPFCLENRVDSMIRYSEYDFIVFQSVIFINEINDINCYWNLLTTKDNDLVRFIKQDIPWTINSVIWRKNAVISIGCWDVELSSFQDWELLIRAIVNNIKYIKIDKADFFKRINNDSISSNFYKIDIIKGRKLAFYKVYELLRKHNRLNRFFKQLFISLFLRNTLQLIDNNLIKEASSMWYDCVKMMNISLLRKYTVSLIFGSMSTWRYSRKVRFLLKLLFHDSYDYWKPSTFNNIPIQ